MNGFALGGGLELALTADTLVAVPTARFAFPETGLGIYPGLGGTQRTVRRIGAGLTKYLIYTGQMISAGEALEIGLVDAVIDWNELDELLRGNVSVETEKVRRPAAWSDIETFFKDHSVSALLTGEFLRENGRPW